MSFHPKMAYGATFHKSSRQLEDEGPAFVYTPENRARFDEIVKRYPPDRRRSAVLPALYLAQYQQGYITANAIRHVAELLGITRADVEDVVSYYTMFYTRPVGKFVLNVCRTLSCAINGAERVTEELCAKLGIKPGETDASGTFTLMEVECLGACDRAPAVMVNDAWHECLTPEDAAKLIDDSARARRRRAQRLPPRVEEERKGLRVRADGPVLLTKYVREPNSFTLDFYLQHDGYEALKTALGKKPDEIIELVKASGLRGRGGAGFPTGMKWQFVDKKVEPRYIVCNADESEPGTFKDHLLMERNPHLLIEGCAIGCYAIGAKVAYIYIRGEFFHVQAVLERAIDEAYAKGLPRQEHPRVRLRLRRLRAPRRRRLRSGRGDGAARVARRQARAAAQQAAVSRRWSASTASRPR